MLSTRASVTHDVFIFGDFPMHKWGVLMNLKPISKWVLKSRPCPTCHSIPLVNRWSGYKVAFESNWKVIANRLALMWSSCSANANWLVTNVFNATKTVFCDLRSPKTPHPTLPSKARGPVQIHLTVRNQSMTVRKQPQLSQIRTV